MTSDPPSLPSLSSGDADEAGAGLSASGSVESFAGVLVEAGPKAAHSAITDALLALLPSTPLSLGDEPPKPLLAPPPLSSTKRHNSIATSASTAKSVRFADPLVSFCISRSTADDAEIESLAAIEDDADALFKTTRSQSHSLEHTENDALDALLSDSDPVDPFALSYSSSDDDDSDSDNDAALPTTPNAYFSDSEATPKRGLIRATRRPMPAPASSSSSSPPSSQSKHMVDELDLLRQKRAAAAAASSIAPKGILKVSDTPPSTPSSASRPFFPRTATRLSRSNLILNMQGQTAPPSPSDYNPLPRFGRSASTSNLQSLGLASNTAANSISTSGRKKKTVSKTTFEQSAMYLNF